MRELYDYDDEVIALSLDHQIHHRYSVIDLSRLDSDQLRERSVDAWSAMILFALREARDRQFLRRLDQLADLIDVVGRMPDGDQRFREFTCYVLTVTPDKSMTGQAVTQTLASAGGHARQAAKTAWEIMQEELMGQGHERGREEGREEGRQEEREESRQSTAEVLSDLLAERFGPLQAAHRDQIRNASLDQLLDWIRQSVKVESLDALFV